MVRYPAENQFYNRHGFVQFEQRGTDGEFRAVTFETVELEDSRLSRLEDMQAELEASGFTYDNLDTKPQVYTNELIPIGPDGLALEFVRTSGEGGLPREWQALLDGNNQVSSNPTTITIGPAKRATSTALGKRVVASSENFPYPSETPRHPIGAGPLRIETGASVNMVEVEHIPGPPNSDLGRVAMHGTFS